MSTISAGTTTPTALSLSGDTTGALTFQVNGTTTAATVTSAGNVGIGTTSPAVQVHATGVGRFSQLQLPNNAGTYTSGSAGFHLFGFSDNALYFNWFDNGAIVFRNNGTTERLRITAAGDVGIGTSSPGTKLDVAGNINVGASGNKNYQIATDSNGLFLLDRTNTRYPFKINAGAYDDALVMDYTKAIEEIKMKRRQGLLQSVARKAGVSLPTVRKYLIEGNIVSPKAKSVIEIAAQ